MAQKDYIKRKPAPRKKGAQSNRRNASAKAVSSPIMAKIKIALAVLVLAGFAYFLYSIKDDATAVTQPEEPVKTVAQPDIDELDPLPELPKEEWAFIKSLPGYEVEVEAEVATSDKRYLMQCGSFKIYAQADSMRATMAFVGLEPQIRGSKSGWYRVILGPYDSKRDAERDRHILQRENINSCKIWFWNL